MDFNEKHIGIISVIGSAILFWDIYDAGSKTKIFPIACIVLLLLMGLRLIFRKNHKVYRVENFQQTSMSIVLVVLYVMALKYVGFLISTILFFMIFLSFNKVTKKRWLGLIYSVAFPIIVFMIFTMLMNVKLPKGVLF